MFAENRKTKILTLGATCFGLFMVMLDNTVVNLALPTIQDKMGSGVSGLQWIVDAFILLLAALMLTGGTLGDLYGRKRAFMAGVVIFTGGSLFCALAPTAHLLIAGRVVQGVGAAIMMPSTLAILTNTFPDPKERAQAIGIWAAVSGISLAIGPVVGGVMVDSFGWQSIFYLNLPIGVIAFVVALLVVKESKNPEGSGLDLIGQALAIVGLGSLTFAFIEAHNYGWTSAVILSLFGVAAVALVAFWLWERRAKTPVLQLDFFRNITFTGANLVGLLLSFGFFGIILFLSLFMQNIQGYSPFEAGIRQLPTSLAVMIFAIISGRVAGRMGARVPIALGMVILSGGVLSFLFIHATTPYSHYWWVLATVGIGTGLVMSPITTAVMSTVPGARAGMASATTNTMRQVGGAFGIAVLGSVVTTTFSASLTTRLTGLGLPKAVVDTIVKAAQTRSGGGKMPSIPGVDPKVQQTIVTTINDTFVSSMHKAVFLAGAVILLGAIVAAIMIRGTAPHEQLARHKAAHATAANQPVSEETGS
jgi:EmrB/QacA subfamily drug resistance transporter